ncbi:helix-turn-helix transcriptional regulator [Actinomadura rudentiformis]|uniref:Helix-turn-helix transcriptional regulator n=1 Tax=Actinomadura rudentiformis TaxID=359158 RepID=A0A6H9YHQ4_9ACTN|nr:AraC family transcriptional regulator [Actinomadura rudentiformis]KAB2340195.1 helix-turn-helix transcriptional regulator [Actinomadura rudentiformis]
MHRQPAFKNVLPGERGAVLWLWPGQALYAGPSLDLDMHAGSVACLAVGVDAPFSVRAEGGQAIAARTALVPPRLSHQLVAGGDQMVFCYLDPASRRARACHAEMTSEGGGFLLGHRAEERLIRLGEAIAESGEEWLRTAAPVAASARADERIRAATRRLLDQPESLISADEMAAAAGLSRSRFLHLFKAQTGTSFRRYRLWTRMLRAASLLDAGHDLTTIAAESGFATPSHLSSAFHGMFGLTPSRLLSAGLTIRITSFQADQ